jgi:hypothetical protein
MPLRGRSLLRSIGPFWADATADGKWGVECKRPDGVHHLATIVPTASKTADQALAEAVAEALNSACGFPRH